MSRKHGPWIIHSSTQKYKNEWIELTEDQVTHPNGQPGIYGVLKMLPGVAVLPLDENGFVYLVKEFRYALGRESIETAGGGIDKGEDDLSAAKRELHEELGILAEDWVDLGMLDPFTNAIAATSHLFLARKLKFVSSEPESIEVIEMKKMKFEEAKLCK